MINKIKIFCGNGFYQIEEQYNMWRQEQKQQYIDITIVDRQLDAFFKGSDRIVTLTIYYEIEEGYNEQL